MWKGFWSKSKWMTLTRILPEFLLVEAFGDLLAAREFLRAFQSLAKPADFAMVNYGEGNAIATANPWTLVHAYYANMGGFVLRSHEHRGNGSYTLVHETAQQVYELMKQYDIQQLLNINKDQIQDKSKEDFFVKISAVVQITWLIIQVTTRANKGLPISQLEIATCSFAGCSLVTCMLWWNKPRNISTATEIQLHDPYEMPV
ncbi:uncharacterized protein PAC_04104 [Phialocephala subalpina]|uniref:Uncharacterized protein n=1 Tax=Phialocephala subalpina TaxID=576137 RepID=A0A1L7WN64_9HELO|nr:uncharacterized protein PAC_04104 [Phialocephala subalpina]